MANSRLPARPSLEYLKKLAKDKLRQMRRTAPSTNLAAAQFAVARDHGFSNWRALKAEVEQRTSSITLFFDACAKGNVEALRRLLATDPILARAANPSSAHGGWTGLHTAAQRGHLDTVRLLLEHGADPNAREAGDNTLPLHWAAANRHLEVVRALLDAGGDADGFGDVHELDAIGWATYYHEPGGQHGDKPEVMKLLLERGARHNIFSAISTGDLNAIRKLVADDPNAIQRRMSKFEHGQTALHCAMSLKRYDILELLIKLGADLEAEDSDGHSALAVAMMRGDREAMKLLHAAGAKGSKGWPAARTKEEKSSPDSRAIAARIADSVQKLVPMIFVPDVARTLDWYTSIGFKEVARYGDDGLVNFGVLSFGKAQLMLNMHGKSGEHDVGLWFYTDHVDELYEFLKSRQVAAAQAVLSREPGDHQGIEFVQDINEPFYGGREFGIRDLNGYILYFRRDS